MLLDKIKLNLSKKLDKNTTKNTKRKKRKKMMQRKIKKQNKNTIIIQTFFIFTNSKELKYFNFTFSLTILHLKMIKVNITNSDS